LLGIGKAKPKAKLTCININHGPHPNGWGPLYKDVQRRVSDLRSGRASDKLFGLSDDEFLRQWYEDDPAWQEAVRDADAAREEQRAAGNYYATREQNQREQEDKTETRNSLASQIDNLYTGFTEEAQKFWENFLNNDSFYSPYQDLLESRQKRDEEEKRRAMAADSSTQGALDEKLAERRYWNELAAKAYEKENLTTVDSGVLYNEHTGEIFVPTKKDNEYGIWTAYSLDGKILVDPEVERRFGVLSNGISAVLTGTGAVVTKQSSVLMLQPIMATLVKAGLLEKKYEGKEYVLNNPHTNEVGISVSGALGARASGSVGIAADCYGNIGIVLSGGGGTGTPNASVGVYSTRTNAPQIDLLSGKSVQIGGAVGPVGVDVVGFCNPNSGEAYYGISTNVGMSLVSADLHASIEHSTVINMKDLFEQLNGM